MSLVFQNIDPPPPYPPGGECVVYTPAFVVTVIISLRLKLLGYFEELGPYSVVSLIQKM